MSHLRHLSSSPSSSWSEIQNQTVGTTGPTGPRSPHSSPSAEAKQKREHDREFLISVLESSATKRDARAYLQTFGSNLTGTTSTGSGPKKPSATGAVVLHDGIRAVPDVPRFVQGPEKEPAAQVDEAPHVAIVKLSEPQAWDDTLLDGVVKTLTQLRDLGLVSVIVVDCHVDQGHALDWQSAMAQQTDRVLRAIGRYGLPAATVVDSGIWKSNSSSGSSRSLGALSSVTPAGHFVGCGASFTTPLQHGHILVVPPRSYCQETLKYLTADANDVVFALASFFSGLPIPEQFPSGKEPSAEDVDQPVRRVVVDRIIVIDPLGGIPSRRQGHGAQVFINLEEEFDDIQAALNAKAQINLADTAPANVPGGLKSHHVRNLQLVRSTLAILPSTASAVITSPAEAANFKARISNSLFAGEVRTRRGQNPLIHNLLTDRPIYSSSLPIGRIKPLSPNSEILIPRMPTTTLAKKGLPLTIFPNTRAGPWVPPKPGAPRLRLTDTCIDLPRLVHLINDSFSRKLDVEHYMNRVQDSLAGIIIAGEYEGGAILTWERPFGMDEETAYSTGRLVPYLDKFAVLKKSQGAGGVADIVFNAMVRDAFPNGVCWRSRKNNPVNKWYFERSCGVRKLAESNWAMFWTSQGASLNEELMKDYENVCRNVAPSWADTKQAAD
ncbi:hypothetical protein B0T22DRAFT_498587 [Podospora appendiculata]|uniref:Amino-acid acetyltransferase, mitochondrial n=1 Tax=Podospora appendiculata TaxID=314037 RepID=A0AAE0X9R9_9PEZI|nr:hypothetical protein B0T22DRAFT_498587 [Podospora appendiculata]